MVCLPLAVAIVIASSLFPACLFQQVPYGPVNCKVSEWSAWSQCSVSCGSGTESRSRSVIQQSSNGGLTCPSLRESRSCSKQCDVPSTTTTVSYATTIRDVPRTTTTEKPYTTTRSTVRDVPVTTTTPAYTTTTTTYATTKPTVRDVPVTTAPYTTTTIARDVPKTTTTQAYETTTKSTVRDVPVTTTPYTTTTTTYATKPTLSDVTQTTTTYATTKPTVRDVPVTTTPYITTKAPTTVNDVPMTTTAYATTTRPTVHDVPVTTTPAPYTTTTTAYLTTTKPTVRDVPVTTTPYTTTKAPTTVRDVPKTTTTGYTTTTEAYTTKATTVRDVPKPTTTQYITTTRSTVHDVPVTTRPYAPTVTTVRDVPSTTVYTTTPTTVRDVPSTTTIGYTTPSTVRDVPSTTVYTTTPTTVRDVPSTTTIGYTTPSTVRDVPSTTVYTTTPTTVRDVPSTTTIGYTTPSTVRDVPSTTVYTTTPTTVRDVPSTTTIGYTTPSTVRDVPSTTVYTTTPTTVRDVPSTTTIGYTTPSTVRDVPSTTVYTTTPTTVRDVPSTTTIGYTTPSTVRDVPRTTTVYYANRVARDLQGYGNPTMPPPTTSTVRDVPQTTTTPAYSTVAPTVRIIAQDKPIITAKPTVATTNSYQPVHKPQARPTPPQGPCAEKADGNYQSGDCKGEYFTCIGGAQLMQNCQHGLVFEEDEDRCEAPENTKTCTGTKPTKPPQADVTIPSATTPHPEFDCSKHENGDYPNPKADKQCGQDFFTCSNAVTNKRNCPAGLWFDPELKICDSWINVPSCSGQPRTSSATLPVSIKPIVDFDCEGKEPGYYPDDKQQCSQKFYACLNGFADEMACPGDLFYNHELQICDRREYVTDCGGSPLVITTVQMDEPMTLPHVNFDCSNREDGYYADTANKCSNTYYSCVGQMARELHCPDDLVFSESEQFCERKDVAFECTGVKPTPSTTPVPVTFTTEKVNFDCANQKNGHFNNPDEKCSNIFYVCSFGHASKGQCAPGTFYDSEMALCDFKENVPQCSGSPRPTTAATSPTTQHITQPPEYDCSRQPDGLYADIKSKCSEFYFSCAHGITTKQKCPDGLFFDVELQICDNFGNIFTCSGSSRAPTTVQNEPAATTPVPRYSCKGKADGIYVDDENKCSSYFYICFGGHTSQQQCPPDLYFDAQLQTCEKFMDIFVCSGKTRPPTTVRDVPQSSPLPPVPIDCKSKPTGDYPNPEKPCSEIYYSCSNGLGFQRQCPANTFFDAEMLVCDIFSNIPTCSGGPRPTTPATAPYQQPYTTASMIKKITTVRDIPMAKTTVQYAQPTTMKRPTTTKRPVNSDVPMPPTPKVPAPAVTY